MLEVVPQASSATRISYIGDVATVVGCYAVTHQLTIILSFIRYRLDTSAQQQNYKHNHDQDAMSGFSHVHA